MRDNIPSKEMKSLGIPKDMESVLFSTFKIKWLFADATPTGSSESLLFCNTFGKYSQNCEKFLPEVSFISEDF